MAGAPIDGLPGWRRLDLASVGSTNNEALTLAEGGDAGHLWVTAGEQLGGRGRRGRDWASPPGNLYASALLIDLAPVARLATLPLAVGVAVHDAIAACGLPGGTMLRIKWPNDLLLNDAKCCGMLLEARGLSNGRQAVVIGCGINIISHPDPGLYPATALNRAGIAATPETLFAHLSRAMEEALTVWDGGRGIGAIRQRWLAAAHGLGARIAVNLASSRIEGIFEGIDADGVLMLRTDDGALRMISAGDLFFGSAISGPQAPQGREPEHG
ncbi:biotin--[acetyl-CoA-carboxylase] ligase [Oricola sp.]|uniref:biotin--[acetyl-CoA-carboxylase] ligase n=1 Tax=Oricola sp. TaxID=1979950 RepID=UPI003BAAE230